ncbi:MAG: Plug domain-containing protein [Gemmatimonadales bacterium]
MVGRYGKPARYANTSKYDEFYHRRATASGRFLTREEIDKSAAGRISELFRAIPGVRVGFGGAQGLSEEVSFLSCQAENIGVWIDGQKMSGLVQEILPLISPLDVEAIEIYPRQSIVPALYRDNSCAAIVMWTR